MTNIFRSTDKNFKDCIVFIKNHFKIPKDCLENDGI